MDPSYCIQCQRMINLLIYQIHCTQPGPSSTLTGESLRFMQSPSCEMPWGPRLFGLRLNQTSCMFFNWLANKWSFGKDEMMKPQNTFRLWQNDVFDLYILVPIYRGSLNISHQFQADTLRQDLFQEQWRSQPRKYYLQSSPSSYRKFTSSGK